MSEPIRLAKGGTKITTFSPSVARDYEQQGFVRVGIDGEPLNPEPVKPEPEQVTQEPAQVEPDPEPVKKSKKSAA